MLFVTFKHSPVYVSEPQLLSLKPWFITPGSEEVRKYNLPKYLVGKQEGGDFIPTPCEMSLGLALRNFPTPSAAGVPHPSGDVEKSHSLE